MEMGESGAGVDATRPEWFRAYSLHERLAGGATDGPGEPDRETGLLRLKMWRQEPLHARDPERFGEHLSRLDVDEGILVRLLGETPEQLRSRFGGMPPDYARRLAVAWQRYPIDGGGAPDVDHSGLAVLAAPLLAQARARVRHRLRAAAGARGPAWVDALVEQFGLGPVETVNQVAGRALVLELNVRRVRGELVGDGPHERYHHFLQLLRRPEFALELLREYPVLARDLVRVVDNWTASRAEFGERLLADYDALAARFGGPQALGAPVAVRFGAGDSHRGGRSVAVVRFDGDGAGEGPRVVYKPRRLSVDVHFQQLLNWLNEHGDHPRLRTLWVLDRHAYGWTEYLGAEACADRAALGRFHRRQGALLALLHTLGAVDFHLENVIAAGEDPMLIDLEALFHGWENPFPAGVVVGSVAREALTLMRGSVLAVGLLPSPVLWIDGTEVNHLDLSGMAGAGGQLSLTPVAAWEAPGTDEMRLIRRRMELPGAANLPSLAGGAPPVTEFRGELVDGYRSMYRTLLRHRTALLADDGPLAAFSDDEVRVVVRPTQAYAKLLFESHHPDLLRDALDRDRFFDHLWTGHPGLEGRERLIAAEAAQLRGGDIPIFSTTPALTDLVGGDGTVLSGILERSGFDVVRERLAALSDGHLAQQVWFIEASLTALVMGDPGRWPRPDAPVAGTVTGTAPAAVGAATPSDTAPAGRYVELARRVGDRLLEQAIVDGDQICWLGLNLIADRMWQLSPAATDLYNGVSGIALFLGRLGAVTGDPRYRRAAERGARMLLIEAEAWAADEAFRNLSGDLGVFGRLGGTVYALSHLSVVLDRADLADTAAEVVRVMAGGIDDDDAYDVITGSAGGILAVLALLSVRWRPELVTVAGRMADRLVATAEVVGSGSAWWSSVNPASPLAGFSHGACGIATALARLDRRTGGRAYVGVVDAALRFERDVVDPSTGNWRDLRAIAEGRNMVAWCHGAGGGALARADLLGYATEEEVVRHELARAARIVRDTGLGVLGNHSICHGDLGNVEALTAAARRLGDDGLARDAAVAAAAVVASIENDRWRCGVPLGVETPGLMSGLAGIGYAMLRLADPAAVPSVLLLEPPV